MKFSKVPNLLAIFGAGFPKVSIVGNLHLKKFSMISNVQKMESFETFVSKPPHTGNFPIEKFSRIPNELFPNLVCGAKKL